MTLINLSGEELYKRLDALKQQHHSYQMEIANDQKQQREIEAEMDLVNGEIRRRLSLEKSK